MKPLAVDLPYPKMEEITPNYIYAQIIAPAYSTKHSELTAILQYQFHALYFNRLDMVEYAEVLISIALAEMEHLHILAELLNRLGLDSAYGINTPFGFQFYNTSCVSYSKTPNKMLLDDIAGEMLAISDYEDMLEKIQDEKISAIISRIILDENLHVHALKQLLGKLQG
ncbi:MAG: manganese catalase family protein [Clostridia bacterium]|nr:manganese catalase family protein [Clostridia bacterium]